MVPIVFQAGVDICGIITVERRRGHKGQHAHLPQKKMRYILYILHIELAKMDSLYLIIKWKKGRLQRNTNRIKTFICQVEINTVTLVVFRFGILFFVI